MPSAGKGRDAEERAGGVHQTDDVNMSEIKLDSRSRIAELHAWVCAPGVADGFFFFYLPPKIRQNLEIAVVDLIKSTVS